MKEFNVILVEPLYPRNIGSAARAVKNFGFNSLILVNPRCEIDNEVRQAASSAQDIIDNLIILNSIDEAVKDSNLVCAASSIDRPRHPLTDVKEVASKIIEYDKVSILFGREERGLTAEEMSKASILLNIPTSDIYPSLNLGVSVAITCYEVSRALPKPVSEPRSVAQRQYYDAFYRELSVVLLENDYCNESEITKKMIRIRRIFDRCELDTREINILMGIFNTFKM